MGASGDMGRGSPAGGTIDQAISRCPRTRRSVIETVVLIGAGGLGSRHLQGIASAIRPLRVVVADPSEEALHLSRARLDEVGGMPPGGSLEFVGSSAHLPDAVDVAIVATTSKPRRRVVEDILERSRVRHLVLEKFLFPVPEDYEAVGSILDRSEVTAWVNCTRRMWPGYQRIREALVGGAPVLLEVSVGDRFQVGTAGIHFVDLLAYLAGDHDVRIDLSGLEAGIEPAKRAGYVEFAGSLAVTTAPGSRLHFLTREAPGADVVVDQGTSRWSVDEPRGVVKVSDAGATREEPFEAPFQSALTGFLVDQLLEEDRCALTPYTESARLHLAVLEPLLDHYRRHVDPEATGVPIT